MGSQTVRIAGHPTKLAQGTPWNIMRIRIEQLKGQELRLEFEARAKGFPVLREMVDARECEFVDPIRVRVRAVRVGDVVEIDGSFETRARLTCGRCLAEFVAPLSGEFALAYAQRPDAETGGAEAQQEERDAAELELNYFRGEEIDLSESLQEQVILSLPLRALCTPECKGLCAGCGEDLNQAACTCAPSVTNGPFSALRGIKLKQGRGKPRP